MVDHRTDPSADTQAFRTFAATPEPVAADSRLSLAAGVAVALVLVIALGWFLLS
ncbi:hypothetical protein ACK8GE_10115 [Micromonosporaceae bacterium DT194]|uniref:hypothetical protein n=1 Tax=Melissospora conviva TaxID=3388432 RepID=UPI003C1C3DF9